MASGQKYLESRTANAGMRRSCVASVMRIVAIGNLKQTDLVCTSISKIVAVVLNPIWLTLSCTDSGASSYMWSQIEPSAAILCACIVTYRPLFRDIRLPSFITGVQSQKNEMNDVSRRWPSNGNSEKGSEAGLIGNHSKIGQHVSVRSCSQGDSDAEAATPDNADRD